MINKVPDPRQFAYIEESARQRRQRDLERSELRRKMEDDGSGAPRQRSPLLFGLAGIAVVVVIVVVVLVLSGIVHV